MASIDKLIKFLNSSNVADHLDDDLLKQIARDVIIGYKIDEDSRSTWLETNKDAMQIIKHCESHGGEASTRDFPFQDSAKVIYPLLAPAVIQMSARLIPHIVQNDKVCMFKVLGPDADGAKAAQATRMTDFASYSFLLESKTWLKDTHKLTAILSSWGTAFRRVYFDYASNSVKNELLAPEDVIINHNITSLDDAPRITIRHLMTKNDIIEQIRAGTFSNIDLSVLDNRLDERENADSRELNPACIVLCQTTYLDLDGDDYAEPYHVYVLEKDELLLGIYPAFDLQSIDFVKDKPGKVKRIERKLDIVDYHLIDDPEGKFYSIGLNYLLVHTNKSITSILRQLLDAGTLANTQGGFITKAFKTLKKRLSFRMGEFQVLDIDPSINPQQHIMPLPFKEPSQVLLGLLQLLIQSGKETGFITDVLTGDIEGQNTPATTALAMIEQGTRAFKPVVQKLYISEKNEFTLWVELMSKNLEVSEDGKKYANFQDQQIGIARQDFDLSQLSICPVADPTQCSEAHKYARVRFLGELLNSQAGAALNVPEVILTVLQDMQIPNAQKMIAPPQQPAPDPKMIKIQADQEKAQLEHQVDMLKLQLQAEKNQTDKMKVMIQAAGLQIDAANAESQQQIMAANVAKSMSDTITKDRKAYESRKEHEDKINVEHRKLDIMEASQRDKARPESD